MTSLRSLDPQPFQMEFNIQQDGLTEKTINTKSFKKVVLVRMTRCVICFSLHTCSALVYHSLFYDNFAFFSRQILNQISSQVFTCVEAGAIL